MTTQKRNNKVPTKTKLAAAVEESMPPAEEAGIQIQIDPNATNLVRQFITDQIGTLLPAQQAVMRETFNSFMQRLVVLAVKQ